jgi:hypothetical protein
MQSMGIAYGFARRVYGSGGFCYFSFGFDDTQVPVPAVWCVCGVCTAVHAAFAEPSQHLCKWRFS